jgi:hypothetical protein
VKIASLKQAVAELQQSQFTSGLESQAMADEIDRPRKGYLDMHEHITILENQLQALGNRSAIQQSCSSMPVWPEFPEWPLQ